jgi:hypothetical protein
MTTAFQSNAFQNNAFQIDGVSVGGGAGFVATSFTRKKWRELLAEMAQDKPKVIAKKAVKAVKAALVAVEESPVPIDLSHLEGLVKSAETAKQLAAVIVEANRVAEDAEDEVARAVIYTLFS